MEPEGIIYQSLDWLKKAQAASNQDLKIWVVPDDVFMIRESDWDQIVDTYSLVDPEKINSEEFRLWGIPVIKKHP